MEVPASTQRSHRRFLPMTLATDHANLGTIWAIRECARDARKRRESIQSYLEELRAFTAYFSGSSSWYEGSDILYCLGRSTQSWRPRGSGFPGSLTGISAWMTGNERSVNELSYIVFTFEYILPRPCKGVVKLQLALRGKIRTYCTHPLDAALSNDTRVTC
jgi:hypothetical protein